MEYPSKLIRARFDKLAEKKRFCEGANQTDPETALLRLKEA